MKKTKFLVLFNWFKKTGKNIFRGVFVMLQNLIATVVAKIQDTRTQGTNKLKIKKLKLKTEKPTVFQSLRFIISNLRFVCILFLASCFLFFLRIFKKNKESNHPTLIHSNYKHLLFQKKKTKKSFNLKLALVFSCLVITLISSWSFLNFQKEKNQNQPTISSNSEEQFQIKKTKGDLNIIGENSSISLKQIKTEKKDFEIYSNSPRADNLQTQVVYFNDEGLEYQEAEITLKKKENAKKVNAITTCEDQDFNQEKQTCNNWQLTNIIPEDQGDFISFKTNHFSAYAGVYIEHTSSQLLNENREFLKDTYPETKAQDDNWITIPKNHYLRVEFEEALDSEKDITLVARSINNQDTTIEIFQKDQNQVINTFQNINEEGVYKVYLDNLVGTEITFD